MLLWVEFVHNTLPSLLVASLHSTSVRFYRSPLFPGLERAASVPSALAMVNYDLDPGLLAFCEEFRSEFHVYLLPSPSSCCQNVFPEVSFF